MRKQGGITGTAETPLTVSASDHEDQAMGFALGNAFDSAAPRLCLGIDPGLQRTGYALIQRTGTGPTLLEGGVIRSSARETLAHRVLEIGQGISELLDEFQPEAVAVEQVFSHIRNPKTALLMAHARGAILYALASRQMTVVHYTPRQMKKLLTGSGRASKDQIQHAVRNELQLKKLLEPNDVADACAIALCHYHSLRTSRLSLQMGDPVKLTSVSSKTG